MQYQSIKRKFFIEKRLFIIFIFCILSLGHLAQGAILIKPSIGASSINHRDDSSEDRSIADGNFSGNDLRNPRAKSFNVIGNLGIYFQFNAGFFTGVTYDMNFININDYIHINTSGLGVTAGYMHEGWYVSATYLFFISGQKSLRQDFDAHSRINYNPINSGLTQNGVQDLKLNRGMGAILQIGYIHFFGDMIGVGPSLQARTILFSEIICQQGVGADCGLYNNGYGGSYSGNVSSLNYRQTYRTFDVSLLLDVFFKI